MVSVIQERQTWQQLLETGECIENILNWSKPSGKWPMTSREYWGEQENAELIITQESSDSAADHA